jgi:putative exporter of polyketide antibiotics
LLDIIVPALGLPDWLRELALTTHYGEPMLGEWNLVGTAASLILALGGLGLGAWGFSRRDLRG